MAAVYPKGEVVQLGRDGARQQSTHLAVKGMMVMEDE